MLGQFTVLYSFVGFFSRDRALRSIQPHSQAAPGVRGLRLLCICAEFKRCFYLPLSPSPPPPPFRPFSPSLSLRVK